MQQQRPRIRRRRRNIWPWFFVIVFGVVLGLVGAKVFTLLSKTNTSLSQLINPPFGGRKFVRILSLGEDNTSKFRSTGRGLSDTIIVTAIDMDTKTVRAISIPRDTRVNIPGHGTQKINSAYAFGGPQAAKEAVQSIIGVSIDYVMRTDISNLKEIVDLVGGVGIDIEKNMYYTDRRGHLSINLKKGYRHLDGEKALGYVRFRHDATGDVGYIMEDGKKVATGRVIRQQKFLRALARQMLDKSNWFQLDDIVETIYGKRYVETDMSGRDLIALAQMAKDIPPDRMEMEVLPGEPQTIDGVSYWIPDMIRTTEVVQRILEPQSVSSTAHTDTTGISAKVAVLNGSGTPGMARIVAEQLSRLGYTVTTTGNADRFDYDDSQVIVCNSSTDGSKIAQLIGCSDIRTVSAPIANSDGADITVIVGRDYRQQ
jgi:LCP family protein required for cell wall assembly